MLKTFELHEYLWRKGPTFKFYLEWNPIQQKFQVAPNLIRIVPWCFLGLLPQLILFALLFFLLTTGLSHPKNNLPINWIIVISILLLNIYWLGINLYFITDFSRGIEFSAYFKMMQIFANTLALRKQFYGNSTKKYRKSERGFKQRLQSFHEEFVQILKLGRKDKLGLLLIVVAVCLSVAPFFVAYIAIAVLSLIDIKIDPFYLTINSIFPTGVADSLYSSPLYLLIYSSTYGLFVAAEVCRILSHVLVSLLVISYCAKQVLRDIHNTSNESGIRIGILQYKRFMVVQAIGKEIISFIVFMTMCMGYCAISVFASVTIIGYKLLPLAIYVVFVIATVIGTLMLVTALPYATYCHRRSQDLINEWKFATSSSGIKWCKLSLSCLQPISFRFGSCRELTNGAKAAYIASIIERLMNGAVFLSSM